jgi:hypothetical protein
MSKSIIVFGLIVSLSLTAVSFVSAQEASTTPSPSPIISVSPSPTVPIMIKSIKPFIKNIPVEDLKQSLSIQEVEGSSLCKESDECLFSNDKFYSEVLINAAKVTDIGEKTIGVSLFGYEYKVNIEETKFVRQYWVASELDEFAVGDIINVFGYLDQSDNYLVYAKTIRNMSIQKRNTIFKGLIGSIDNVMKTFVLQTPKNGDQTVVVNSGTKIVKSEPIFCIQMVGARCPFATSTLGAFEDLTVGEALVVRGLWSESSGKITAESIIIGFDGRPLFNNLGQLQSQIQERFQSTVSKPSKGIWQKIFDIFKGND